ncbi:hypothetical protein [Lichenicoccus sp.]|uniref:hypothetical protein n=1 Tax=Lichenicoccus sp. TaxID=2781899 RepID=UPI003D0C81CF
MLPGPLDLRSPDLSASPGLETYGTFGSFGTKLFGAEGSSGSLADLGGAKILLDLTRE